MHSEFIKSKEENKTMNTQNKEVDKKQIKKR